MGISGLLPLLKPIQVNKHLSEFAGQTLAIDAYVWLHRGVYTCATELATGKKTTKYVDYAMHRVRLLRHHHIQPFVVFDGGPLPAKKGTETARKQKREDNLASGNALAAQGKHNQAREYYVKCVDVTPQMAFQLIKALRAENVPYIVAPYEADAQLRYLELVGIVDGIITEDSDLLVFGCKNVLFKLDSVSSTITSISRSDFGSVSSGAGDGAKISLTGWSDAQFRAMAILSGCDYLPSIPGIGLKTAYSLLRKHKSAKNVIRAVRIEGKKNVPRRYEDDYKKAENVFLYQRVWDPVGEVLVHLHPVPEGDKNTESWGEDMEAFVGKDIECAVAMGIAKGDIDPVTLKPMEDINPSFVPRVINTLPLKSTNLNRSNGKGKEVIGGGLLNFFTRIPNLKPRPEPISQQSSKKNMVVGRASGKRTLAEVMDEDLAIKRKKLDGPPAQSRFFAKNPSGCATDSRDPSQVAGPSRLHDPVKENVPPLERDADLNADFQMDDDMAEEEYEWEPDFVQQEDGYISPSSWDDGDGSGSDDDTSADFSSPVKTREVQNGDDFGVDPISSPPMAKRIRDSDTSIPKPKSMLELAHIADVQQHEGGVDLRDAFGDELASEIDGFDDDGGGQVEDTPTPTPSPETPIDQDIEIELDMEDAEDLAARTEIVATGWWTKYAMSSRPLTQHAKLKRRDTAVTPAGRHSAAAIHPSAVSRHSSKRHSLFPNLKLVGSRVGPGKPKINPSLQSARIPEEILSDAQTRLARFRCHAVP